MVIVKLVLLHVLHQHSVLLLESQADSLGVLQELLRTLVDTSRLFAGQVGGGEVVDTVIETSRDQVGVKSHEILHLLLLNNLLKLLLFFDVQLIHVGVICIDIWGAGVCMWTLTTSLTVSGLSH